MTFGHKFRTALLVSTMMAGAAVPLCAHAATQLAPNVTMETQLKAQLGDTLNGDLDTSGRESVGEGATEAKFKVTANLDQDALFYWEGRAVGGFGKGGIEGTDGAVSNTVNFLEWRQSYLQFGNIGSQEPVSMRIGRQRVAEPYGLWWNRDFDGVRLSYDTTLFKGALIGGQNLFSYRTGDGRNDFQNNDRDLARVIAQGSWQYYYNHFFEARAMYQDDHSGLSVGDPENPLNPDSRTGNLFWAGVRAAGKSDAFKNGADKMSYRADLMTVRGSEDVATIGGNAVAALTRQHVAGWAFDAATDIPLPAACNPSLHLGYAYGSGDGNAADSTDHSFRQTGLQGNFSPFGALSENTNNYGTVLRPDLSNIHVFSAGVTMPVLKASNIGGIYRFYRLADPAAALAASGIRNNVLNGVNRQLGQGFDLLFNMNALKEGVVETNKVQDVDFRSSLGFFHSGAAYGASRGEIAMRGLVEVRVGF